MPSLIVSILLENHRSSLPPSPRRIPPLNAYISALPDDTEPWGATKTGRAAATTEDCRSGSNSPVSPTIVVGDAACAFKEKHNTESHPAAGGVDEQAGVAPCSDERPAQQQQQHEWTVDPHLANDPRNYKLLPRWVVFTDGEVRACSSSLVVVLVQRVVSLTLSRKKTSPKSMFLQIRRADNVVS